MPTISIEGPIIKDIDVKRKLVREMTRIAVEAYGIPSIVVLIKENPPENVGVDGELVCDRRQRQADK
jgi:4-oxalocrotonate tautomerase